MDTQYNSNVIKEMRKTKNENYYSYMMPKA